MPGIGTCASTILPCDFRPDNAQTGGIPGNTDNEVLVHGLGNGLLPIQLGLSVYIQGIEVRWPESFSKTIKYIIGGQVN